MTLTAVAGAFQQLERDDLTTLLCVVRVREAKKLYTY